MICILLAGGRARRLLGGDKGLHVIGDATIIEHIAERLRPQCDGVILNANGDPDRFASLGFPVVADNLAAGAGPLTGVLAGLDHVAKNYPRARFALTVPTDTPFLPIDLVARLADAQLADNAVIVCARSQQRLHPLTGLWDVSIRDHLRESLRGGGPSKVLAYIARHACAYADWPGAPYDPFFNVNTNQDLEEARRIYAEFIRSPRP